MMVYRNLTNLSFLITFLLSILLGTGYAQHQDGSGITRKSIRCKKAAVVSAHPLASEAGVKMLKKGGNAFDAAIATQLALAVVYPGAGNLGGGGFLLAHRSNGEQIFLDYRETAPGSASKDMYLDSSGIPIKGLSQNGPLASGVPGTVAGLFATLPYAKLPFRTLAAPAIHLAKKGFRINAAQAQAFNNDRQLFLQRNRLPIAFVKDSLWKAGDLLIQTELANTIERIVRHGADEFYKGKTARFIVAEMQAGNGIITFKDLESYQVKKREPIDFLYKGHRVLSAPLPSSGGIILQQLLTMCATRNLPSMGFHSTAAIHCMVEAERRAYADRASYLGDPDYVKVPVKQLTDSTYLQQRINDIIPGLAGSSNKTKAGGFPESEETTHISIFDPYGNAIAITTTLNDHFGNRTVVSGAGFLLNNEMDDFSIKEGYANLYGVTGSAANAISAGKRMLSSMTPTIVLKGKRPVIIVGSPGGSTIPTTVFQTLVNLIDFKLKPGDAVNLPKFHHQWLPDEIYVEPDFLPSLSDSLAAMGYKIKPRGPIGRTELICISYQPLIQINAVADKRGDDAACGY